MNSRSQREERKAENVGPLTRPSEIRAVNFLLQNNLLNSFMDSLLTYKHFYVNLMIGKRIIRLRLPILDCGIAPGGESRGFFVYFTFFNAFSLIPLSFIVP